MRLPPFSDEVLKMPDIEVGEHLLRWWIADQANLLGFDPYNVPQHVEEKIKFETIRMDTDEAHCAAMEKALIKAVLGDFAKAGKLLKGDMMLAATFNASMNMIGSMDEDTKRGIKVRRCATLGNEAVFGTPVEKETKRRQLLDFLDEIRKENPKASNRKIHEIAEAASEERFGRRVSYKAFERAQKKEKS